MFVFTETYKAIQNTTDPYVSTVLSAFLAVGLIVIIIFAVFYGRKNGK